MPRSAPSGPLPAWASWRGVMVTGDHGWVKGLWGGGWQRGEAEDVGDGWTARGADVPLLLPFGQWQSALWCGARGCRRGAGRVQTGRRAGASLAGLGGAALPTGQPLLR